MTSIENLVFWETLWFKIIIMLLLVFGLYLFLKWKKMNLEKKKQRVIYDKKNEDNISFLNESLLKSNESKNDLSLLIHNQKILIQSITHDIKAPLRYITNGCKYIFEESKEEEIRAASGAIHETSLQLYNYVDNLLNYAKVFTEREKEKKELVSIHHLFEDNILLFKNIAKKTNTQIVNNLQTDLKITVNNVFLIMIIHNLIDNAIKNTKNGFVYLDAFENENNYVISVSDNGGGISKEKLSQLQNSKPIKSPGIDYIIINELILIMNAKLIIESEINKETKVTILLKK